MADYQLDGYDDLEPLPTDPAELLAYTRMLQQQIREMEGEIGEILKDRYEVNKLHLHAAMELHYIFNEAESTWDIFNEFESIEQSALEHGLNLPNPLKPRGKKKKKKEFCHLPIGSTTNHELSTADRMCSNCDEPMVEIGEQSSFRIEVEAKKARQHIDITKRYSCKVADCQAPVGIAAPLPARAVSNAQLSEGAIAAIALQKFIFGHSLSQIENAIAQTGHKIAGHKVSRWLVEAGLALEPIYDLLDKRLFQSNYIQISEAMLGKQENNTGMAAGSFRIWLRCLGGPSDSQIFLFSRSESADYGVTKERLNSFRGYLQTSGIEGSSSPAADHQGIVRVGCMDILFQLFTIALNNSPQNEEHDSLSDVALMLINELFGIEEEIATSSLEHRLSVRKKEAAQILDEIKALLTNPSGLATCRKTERARLFALDRWPLYTAYLSDPKISISNVRAEKALGEFTFGQKKWSVIENPKGTKGSLILYSLLRTAIANNLNPCKYLTMALKEIPQAHCEEQVSRLLPVRANSSQMTL